MSPPEHFTRAVMNGGGGGGKKKKKQQPPKPKRGGKGNKAPDAKRHPKKSGKKK